MIEQFTTNAPRLGSLASFGANPGRLEARIFIPNTLRPGAPLVVALHGCTQDAAVYDRGTGWSTLAERAGFALLLPEQTRASNPNNCFNWFSPPDVARLGGEAESIANMVRATLSAHRLDPDRVFVTGLSAGGAMTAAMLATWPELFAGGAIIGGLPYGDASGVPEALARMRGQGGKDHAALATAVRRTASGHEGRWPTVSIWHGEADATVNPVNADRLGRQWRGVHGVTGDPEATAGTGWTRRAWRAGGRVVVEEWLVEAMGHGVPIDPDGPDGLGQRGPHMLDVGVGSTAQIARGWGLIPAEPPRRERPAIAPPAPVPGVQQTIERALRAAGLMR